MVDTAKYREVLETRLAELQDRLQEIDEALDSHQSKDWEELATEREGDEVLEQMGSTGKAEIATGIGFLDHMLEQLARHGLLDITLQAEGDLLAHREASAGDLVEGIGENQPHRAGQFGQRRSGDVDPGHFRRARQFAAIEVGHKAGQRGAQGGFARAVGPDDGAELPGRYLQGEIVQRRGFRARIRISYVCELNHAASPK